jgi:histidinol-phosphate phosphatase family protein
MLEPTELGLEKFDLIIFDLDGTLVEPRIGAPGKPHFRAHAHDWQLKDGILPVLRECRRRQIELAIATNQGGVAFSIVQPLDITRAVNDAAYLLGIYFVYICMDHPDSRRQKWAYNNLSRKPAPGMLLYAMRDAHVENCRTLMVGDLDTDEQAAENAGCAYMRASDFFGTVKQLMNEAAQRENDFPF